MRVVLLSECWEIFSSSVVVPMGKDENLKGLEMLGKEGLVFEENVRVTKK